MKIAYLILAHIDPEHIARLCNKLTYKTENICFLHVDEKVDNRKFVENLKDNKQVYFTPRHAITWGGIEAVKTTLEMFEVAYNYAYFNFLLEFR